MTSCINIWCIWPPEDVRWLACSFLVCSRSTSLALLASLEARSFQGLRSVRWLEDQGLASGSGISGLPKGSFLDPKASGLPTPRVQSTQIWSLYGFSIRTRKYGLEYKLHIWVLGPLENWCRISESQCSVSCPRVDVQGFLQPYPKADSYT